MSNLLTKHRLLFGLILLAGAALRFYGLDWGTDTNGHFHRFHPDEETLINAAANLQFSLQPTVTAYGTLPMYLLHLWGWPTAAIMGTPLFADTAPLTNPTTYLVARALSALIALATLWLVFALGRRTDNYQTGLGAAGLLSFCALPIQQAHYYTTDTLFAGLTLGALLLCAAIAQGRSGRIYLLVGLTIGLATATRLNGILLLVPLATAHLCSALKLSPKPWPQIRAAAFDRQLWLAVGTALVATLALQPYILLNPDLYLTFNNSSSFRTSLAIASGDLPRTWTLFDAAQPPYFFQLKNHLYYALGPLLQISGLAGAVYLGFRRRPADWVLLSWMAIYLLTIGHLDAKNIRYILPLAPCLALSAAQLGTALFHRFKVAPYASALVALGTLWWGLAYAQIYRSPDSRLQAADALDQHFATNSRLGIERTGLSMEKLVHQAGYDPVPLNENYVFNVGSFLLDSRKIAILFEPLSKTDGLALIDAARANHFLAAAQSHPILAGFYQRLADGDLGFDQVASFKTAPGWAGLSLDESSAETSLYGFDHPRVTLYQRSADAQSLAQIRQSWQEQIANDPALPEYYLATGVQALAAADYGRAQVNIDKAAALRPGYHLPRLLRCELYERRLQPDTAQQLWDTILAQTGYGLPQGQMWDYETEGFFWGGKTLIDLGATITGRRCLNLVEPALDYDLARRLGNAYLQAGFPADALRTLRPVVEREPLNTAALHNLCIACADVGQLELGRRYFQRYTRIQTNPARLQQVRAALYPEEKANEHGTK